MTAPREYDVELPSHSAHVLEWGPEDGRLLVALHGFPDTAWTWRRVAPLLAEDGWRVAAPFLRGYAPSGLPADGDYSVRALVGDAIALHGALGGDAETPLVGHDWGAITTNAVAADPASPYAKHVSLAVPPFSAMNPTRATLRPWAKAMVRQPLHSWYIALNQVPGLSERRFEWLTTRLWRLWSPGYDATEELAHLRAAVPDRARATAVVSYYRALLGRGVTPATLEPVHPLLVLHGAGDRCMEPGLARLAGATLVPGAGHFLQLEQPEAVAAEIRRYLA
ncbi:alpha/beta fold hydrolase [Nocardioides mangrovi]|uniref:Alpha/beta fold hydrolase n=1 Tax=Nocardioides mangrovi TaxID=2874580 RepID=A0ABS7UHN0_9ACTN|nr:alpha/beta fold hydrolase [Nocardioides mangrovi]MBZ5740506.1 alpha/beta fold hydrolase [Nocardioides mangrovi]